MVLEQVLCNQLGENRSRHVKHLFDCLGTASGCRYHIVSWVTLFFSTQYGISRYFDILQGIPPRFRQSLFACRAWLRVVGPRDGGMLGGCQSVRGDGWFFVPEACFLGEFRAKVLLRWLSRHCFGSGEVYVTDQ